MADHDGQQHRDVPTPVLGRAHGAGLLRALVYAVLIAVGSSAAADGGDDPDGDGVRGAADRCPKVPGIAPHGCPPRDRDGDQVLDHKDRCPDLPGPVANGGCPDTDADRDGVADRIDRCPKRYGSPEHAGCPPPDTDADGIPDARDRCKRRREVWNGVRDTDGCPDRPAARVRLAPGVVTFAQRLRFVAADSRVSRAADFDIRIAAALVRSLRPGRVRVVVVAEYGLSYGDSLQKARRRAAAVVRALTKRVPEHTRLVAAPAPPDGRPRVELHYR